jgi:uncharacterized Zn-binding protein involved in type VI secretion
MPGPPVSIGCAIVSVLQTTLTASGMPLATSGSICQMVNSVSGAPYPLTIGTLGASTGVTVDGQGLVRVGDQILSGSGMLMIIGPPAAPTVSDGSSP